MTRSRLRKLKRIHARNARQVLWKAAPVASALLSCMPAARAADEQPETVGLAEVVVTAQKRTENLQDVPISIQALGTQKLEEMNVANFDDYVKMLPGVSFQSAGPSFEHTYMRGVVSGGDGNHSGSLPSVGMYLDEQPVTTIDGNLNIHIYDIARIESLSGPQGTLYGASSESGTIRIITNKPDTSGFKAGYDLEANTVTHGGQGYTVEGFVNIPLSDKLAVRLVGWQEHDAGYIDNVHGSVTFPTSGITMDNSNMVKSDYNGVDITGGRAALKFNIDDNWSILPQIMGQVSDAKGNPAYNPAVGDLDTLKFFPEDVHDSWVQSALTIEGKISNFDVVYAGAYLTRNTHETEDYTDYSLFYDTAYGSGADLKDNAGNLINPAQYIIGRDHYSKTSHEIRVSSPADLPLRFTGGFFIQRQVHEILQDYTIPGDGTPLGSVAPNDLSIPGWPGSIWLTDQERVDRDRAVFGEATYDITSALSLKAGLRHYWFDNTLQGFYGFNSTYSSSEGVATCFPGSTPFHGAPCQDLNGRTSGAGNSPKVSLSYKFDRDLLVYATWSKGFRPGGVNRNGGGTLPPYKPDYLTNYEIGWKTSWFDRRLRWNGAIFDEKWKDFQFAFLGPNALTIIANAGEAEIKGIESDLEFAVTDGLVLSGGFSYLDAKLTQAYCDDRSVCGAPNFDPIANQYEEYAPSGAPLPVTPKLKANMTARYTFSLTDDLKAHVQASGVYVGARWADLRTLAAETLGREPAYAMADLAAGLEKNSWTAELFVTNAFDKRAILDRYAECDASSCGQIAIYSIPATPRTVGIRFGQRF
ncbi:MAG TPA: TonB-dependent receptor [Steroidobacteraceae bacterium]|nr:TonB-dependent receptor [Steroidobacteraceae bacterium]